MRGGCSAWRWQSPGAKPSSAAGTRRRSMRSWPGGYAVREAVWSEALAVGSRQWLARLGPQIRGATVTPFDPVPGGGVAKSSGLYVLRAPTRQGAEFWCRQQEKR